MASIDLLRFLTGAAPTLSGVLRARAVIMIARSGQTLRAASVDAGRGPAHFARRLDTRKTAALGVRLRELEELAEFAGCDPAELLSPVLLPVDVHVLRFIGQQSRKMAELGVFNDAEGSLARLRSQWLIEQTTASYYLTNEGHACLARLALHLERTRP